MNTYEITFTRENGNTGKDRITAVNEKQARKDFREIYRHSSATITDVIVAAENVPASKQQERDALDQIRAHRGHPRAGQLPRHSLRRMLRGRRGEHQKRLCVQHEAAPRECRGEAHRGRARLQSPRRQARSEQERIEYAREVYNCAKHGTEFRPSNKCLTHASSYRDVIKDLLHGYWS